MLLVSYEFLLFFILLVMLYYVIPGRAQWVLLLAASYFFFLSGGWKPVIFILITTLSTWILGLKLGKRNQAVTAYIKENQLSRQEKKEYRIRQKKISWRWLLMGLWLNFGILGVLKYTNFILGNMNGIFYRISTPMQLKWVDWILPLGISYYTFQSMGYLIDIYRNKYKPEKHLGHFALFISFFPQLIQGPITRFDEMKEQLTAVHFLNKRQIAFGLQRMLWGYFKKLIVADRLVHAVTAIGQNPEQYRGSFVLVGMICYTLQIYADFSGGIDIVIGAAQVLGIKLPENFERPYFSKTVGEYWRRWHMSLMTWLREYIFYPASVCGPVTRMTRWGKEHLGEALGRRIPVYVATLIVWFVTGIWHGASWNFVFWGLLNGIVLLLSSEMAPWQKRFHEKHPGLKGKTWFSLVQIGRTLLVLSVIQTLEYYGSVSRMLTMQFSMLTEFSLKPWIDGSLFTIGLDGWDWLVVFQGLFLMLIVSLWQRKGSVRERIAQKPEMLRWTLWAVLFLLVITLGTYGHGFEASQFIYNQF